MLRRVLRVHPRDHLVRLGSAYGGYVIPGDLPRPDWICYSAGVGEDVSFDTELIERYGCSVFAFDPTPRAVAFAKRVKDENPHFHFEPYGLWSSDGEVQLFSPRDPAHVSHSVLNLQRTASSITAPVRTLSSAMRNLGHTRIDILKLDIEGAEHEVIASLLGGIVRPTVVCVEFDQPSPLRGVLKTVRDLTAAGYELISIDRWNYTFVHP